MTEERQVKKLKEVVPERETYQAPELVNLGAWRELTRTLPGTGFGGGQGG